MKSNVAVLMLVLVSSAMKLPAQCGVVAGSGIAIAGCRGSAIRPGFPRCGRGHWVQDDYGSHWDFECTGEPRCGRGHWVRDDRGSQWDFECADVSSFSVVLQTAAPKTESPAPLDSPPPLPASVTHEYSWTTSGNDQGTEFAIISNDGAVYRAIAVWIQDGRLCFVTPDGVGLQLPLEFVDRQNTIRINSERKLKICALNTPGAVGDPHTTD